MAEIITNDPSTVTAATEPTRAQERITELSDKVKTEAEGRQKAENEKLDAQRRADFAEGFVDVIATNPGAKDHKDEIKEKVLKGYTIQDATFAVLGAAGKLGGTSTQTTAPQVAGGSATTTVTTPQKGVKEMTQAERRSQLEKDLRWA